MHEPVRPLCVPDIAYWSACLLAAQSHDGPNIAISKHLLGYVCLARTRWTSAFHFRWALVARVIGLPELPVEFLPQVKGPTPGGPPLMMPSTSSSPQSRVLRRWRAGVGNVLAGSSSDRCPGVRPPAHSRLRLVCVPPTQACLTHAWCLACLDLAPAGGRGL